MSSGLTVRSDQGMVSRPIRFAPFWGLFLFILIVVTVLFFLFPKEELLQSLEKQRQADKVVKQYLVNLVDLYPKDQELKLLLAEQHLGFADVQQALKTIQPYLTKKSTNSKLYSRAQWIYYRILEVTTFALPPASEARLAGENQLKGLVKKLLTIEGMNTEQLLVLGNGAALLGLNEEALGLYQRVVKLPPSRAKGMAELYVKAGSLALGYSQYLFSAQLYFLAQKSASDEKAAASYYVKALQSLVSGNLLNQALNEAQANLSELSNNQEVLLYLVSLARSANNTQLAQQYMLKILNLKYQDNADQTS